ncbi:hypothetical protein KCU65_g139, partial [Aureobasidium melanogenum]
MPFLPTTKYRCFYLLALFMALVNSSNLQYGSRTYGSWMSVSASSTTLTEPLASFELVLSGFLTPIKSKRCHHCLARGLRQVRFLFRFIGLHDDGAGGYQCVKVGIESGVVAQGVFEFADAGLGDLISGFVCPRGLISGIRIASSVARRPTMFIDGQSMFSENSRIIDVLFPMLDIDVNVRSIGILPPKALSSETKGRHHLVCDNGVFNGMGLRAVQKDGAADDVGLEWAMTLGDPGVLALLAHRGSRGCPTKSSSPAFGCWVGREPFPRYSSLSFVGFLQSSGLLYGVFELAVFSLVMDIAQFAGEEWPGTKESGAEPMSQFW